MEVRKNLISCNVCVCSTECYNYGYYIESIDKNASNE